MRALERRNTRSHMFAAPTWRRTGGHAALVKLSRIKELARDYRGGAASDALERRTRRKHRRGERRSDPTRGVTTRHSPARGFTRALDNRGELVGAWHAIAPAPVAVPGAVTTPRVHRDRAESSSRGCNSAQRQRYYDRRITRKS